jgi:hypothetical protein
LPFSFCSDDTKRICNFKIVSVYLQRRAWVDALKRASGKLLEFLRRFANWFLIFRPHFWHVRARRCQVQVKLQKLLPAPYDPYGIELAYRSQNCEVSTQRGIPFGMNVALFVRQNLTVLPMLIPTVLALVSRARWV